MTQEHLSLCISLHMQKGVWGICRHTRCASVLVGSCTCMLSCLDTHPLPVLFALQGGVNRSLTVAYPLDASSGRLALPRVLPCTSLLPVLGRQSGAEWDGTPCGAATNAATEEGTNRSGDIEVGGQLAFLHCL